MSNEKNFDRGRLLRLLTLIVFVTAVSLFVLAARLDVGGELFQVGVVAIGAVAVVTAITGFLIAVESAFEEPADDPRKTD
jgi:hypothetical protein